ncbi:oxidoreductase [Mesorhizobium sp. J428]|uniref:oxidoreductase n=1 Tax=Mesorhizobium sp. J428 TaxID=2898440 RepID=UPI00215106BE|nr:oxidoreductase [Mesorhizobium sp. J428]MCR5857828.1 SDR family NAD(P)-dependent oxidoreductase [Mesorhizobium sp. J428]
MASPPVWFITGCSTGLGHELAKLVAARGWNLVATARRKESLADLAAPNVLALSLDVTKQDEIDAAVAAAKERFGRIDVLVNNAGYGYLTTVEEGEDAEIRAMFEANVFGLFAMTRAVLPVMRAQRSGHIINITSVAGHVGNPSSGYYAATKHAVEGLSKSLAVEGAPLGIKVTAVAPGPFRTDWAGRSMIQTPNRIEDYASTAGTRMRNVSGYSGQQAGDPVRAGEAMITLTQMENPPVHIVLGRGGFDVVTASLRNRLAEIEAYRELGIGTDFPA